ncbi:MAG TPA: serine hydrolase [Dehalococcoidia bacterium]|nr:serine hydrolase [Dehalococcoidia bacterium]
MSSYLRLITLLGVSLACVAVTACSSGGGDSPCAAPTEQPAAATVENAVYPDADWETSSPEAEGMDAAPLKNIDPYCVEHGCRAVVVIRHGRIVWERYWGGWDETSTDNSWSMAKSVTSALVGIAVDEGKIRGLDQAATDFIPEWRGDRREGITVGDLLSMTSGLTWAMLYDPPSGDTARMLGSDDQIAYALNRQLYREPGTDWYYSDGDAQSFSRIIKAATGVEVGEYAQEKLFGPIGMESAYWMTDRLGHAMTYCCIMTTARDFARFGYLFLRNGKWGDEQVVPAGWVMTSTQPSQFENMNYGYYWWLIDFPDVPKDMYAAMGFATKRLYVIPSLDIVAVRLGEGNDLGWNDTTFLKPIVDAAGGP